MKKRFLGDKFEAVSSGLQDVVSIIWRVILVDAAVVASYFVAPPTHFGCHPRTRSAPLCALALGRLLVAHLQFSAKTSLFRG